MDHYIEISLKNCDKRYINQIINEIISFIHKQIIFIAPGKIGISFPDYDEFLGTRIRIHGSEDLLKQIQTFNLAYIKGVYYTEVLKIPDDVSFAVFSRKRPSKQNSKLKRYQKKGIMVDSKKYIREMCREVLEFPYFNASSTSTKQSYKVFVSYKKVDKFNEGKFDSFGLSSEATVPLF